MIKFTTMPSPVGELTLTADGDALTGVWFANHRGESPRRPEWIRDDDMPVLKAARRELTEYFAGKRSRFDVKLKPEGTAFQQAVWRQLLKVGFGKTSTYGTLAAAIGKANASRAVGAAVGANPISIIVPCHRIIGRDGSLTGFGGGLDRKAKLLRLEGVLPA
jgi:methylated-DNA-[protein]-cysteine S-methyltransferase